MIEDQTNTINETQDAPVLDQGQDSIDEQAGNGMSRIKMKLKDLNVILSLMFAFALGGMYLLGMNTSLVEASPEQQAAENKIEKALAKMNSTNASLRANAKEKKLISDTINYQVSDRQIPHSQLSGNPFYYKLDWASGQIDSGNNSAENGNYNGIGSLSVRQMAIQSILASDEGGIALINNNVLHIGDQISGWTVITITGESVTLQLKNQTQTLFIE